jgi:pimeloyl-ACP methyl ester carboxylesterase
MSDLGPSPSWSYAAREGTHLACADYGGDGSPVVLLHGLAGNAREWDETAAWLVESHRVLALDARGHGESERRPGDVSRAAHVADVVFWLNELDLESVQLVGQSLGGHTALLVAARHPDLIGSLIVAESTPAAGPHFPQGVRKWLESWPVPFESREAAILYFGGDTIWARGWASGLEATTDGLRPRFDVDVMVASLDEIATTAYWDDWRRVRTPSLIVRAEHGVPRKDALRMAEMQRQAQLVEIADAKHDVHLDKPIEWREVVGAFLRTGESAS